MKFGFVKVAAAIPSVKVADCLFNAQQTEKQIIQAEEKGVQIIIFPELNLTGYSCGDLFEQGLLLEQAEFALMQIMNNTRQLDIISIVGLPVVVNSTLLNCAVVFQKGKILGVVPKTYLPNYKEFYEQRWFAPSTAHSDDTVVRLCGQLVPVSANLLFETSDVCFGVEICEDVWATIPPSSTLALKGAEIFSICLPIQKISASTSIYVLCWLSSRHVVWPDMYLLLPVLVSRLPMWYLPVML